MLSLILILEGANDEIERERVSSMWWCPWPQIFLQLILPTLVLCFELWTAAILPWRWLSNIVYILHRRCLRQWQPKWNSRVIIRNQPSVSVIGYWVEHSWHFFCMFQLHLLYCRFHFIGYNGTRIKMQTSVTKTKTIYFYETDWYTRETWNWMEVFQYLSGYFATWFFNSSNCFFKCSGTSL